MAGLCETGRGKMSDSKIDRVELAGAGCSCPLHRPVLSRRQVAAGLVAGTALTGLTGCFDTNPATGRSSFTGLMSVDDDIRLGRQEHPKMVKAFGGTYDDPKLNDYVTNMGNRLAQFSEYPQFPYQFTILDSPIVNAFALPGGYVYISRGLLALASNEAELAGVLAHEIGHVNARHSAERLGAGQLAQFGLLLGALGAQAAGLPAGDLMRVGQSIATMAIQGYSRQQELEADMLGIRYMTRNGYDPEAMVSFLSTLREHSQLEARALGMPAGKVDEFNIMATHPRTIDRVREAEQLAATARPENPRIARDLYLNKIDGMMFGDNPKEGVVRGRRFIHPGLRFSFEVPAGYVIRNQPDKVAATDPNGNAIVFSMGAVRQSNDMVGYLTREWAAKTRLNGVEKLQVSGLDAATGYIDQQGQSGPLRLRAVVIRRDREMAYRFLYATKQQDLQRLSAGLRASTYSFKPLSEQEAAKIKALRLLIVPASGGDSVGALAKTLPFDRLNEDWFRVLNDMKPGDQLKVGQRLKVVAA